MKTVKTKKGTELPLVNLKGKDYLMVAYRIQWLSEDVDSYVINTRTTHRTDDTATVEATISIYGLEGKLVRQAQARKTEAKKEFADFEEKAETGAIGRALAMLGFGTQHAIADLDEGDRIVDAPVVNTKTKKEAAKVPDEVSPAETLVANGKKPTFKKSSEPPAEAVSDDW